MSSRNRKVKPIEAKLRKEITNLEDEILNLHEENSELRNIVDQQNDYIKTEVKAIRDSLKKQYMYQGNLNRALEEEKELRRSKDNELREEVALIGRKISITSLTWLGKFIFK